MSNSERSEQDYGLISNLFAIIFLLSGGTIVYLVVLHSPSLFQEHLVPRNVHSFLLDNRFSAIEECRVLFVPKSIANILFFPNRCPESNQRIYQAKLQTLLPKGNHIDSESSIESKTKHEITDKVADSNELIGLEKYPVPEEISIDGMIDQVIDTLKSPVHIHLGVDAEGDIDSSNLEPSSSENVQFLPNFPPPVKSRDGIVSYVILFLVALFSTVSIAALYLGYKEERSTRPASTTRRPSGEHFLPRYSQHLSKYSDKLIAQ